MRSKKNSANTTQVSLRSTLYLLRLLWSMDVEIWDFLQSNHLPKTFRKGCWFRNSGLSSLSSLLVMGLVLPSILPRQYTHVIGGMLFLYFGIKLIYMCLNIFFQILVVTHLFLWNKVSMKMTMMKPLFLQI